MRTVFMVLFVCPLFRCPEDDKLISKFQGTWAQRDSMYETVIYAHMKTFRFTGTPALYIECDIRMCHGSCPVILTLKYKYNIVILTDTLTISDPAL